MIRLLAILLIAASVQAQSIKIFNFAGTAPTGGGPGCDSPPFYEDFSALTTNFLDTQGGWKTGVYHTFSVLNGSGVYSVEPSWVKAVGARDSVNCVLTDNDKQWVSFIYKDGSGGGGGTAQGAMFRANAAMDTLQWVQYDKNSGGEGFAWGTQKGTTLLQFGFSGHLLYPDDSVYIKVQLDTCWIIVNGLQTMKQNDSRYISSSGAKYIGISGTGDDVGWYIKRWRGGNW